MATNKQVGQWGEDLATESLVVKGYDIVERNWRLGHLEIDIIARHKQRIIFVEVKTRTDEDDDDPATLITRKKLTNLCRSINAYMQLYNLNFEAQIDVMVITGTPEDHRIEHYPDCYYPPMKTY